MRYFSMFSGIGGFERGIELAYKRMFSKDKKLLRPTATVGDKAGQPEQLDNWSSEGLLCVGYSEIDKYAIQIYERHFGGQCENSSDNTREHKAEGELSTEGESSGLLGSKGSIYKLQPAPVLFNRGHKNYGNARDIIPEQLPDFDLLVGGFPCQAFSIAGKRGGFDDTRGTLFFEIARILRVKRPKRVLLENVKGLLNHDSGKTFQTILKVLSDIGYRVEWQVLNSKDFGVPQNRERVFIVGHFGKGSRGQVFPIGESDATTYKGFNENSPEVEVAQTIRQRYGNGTGSHLMQIVPGSQGMRVYDSEGIATTIAGLAGGMGAKTGLYAIPCLTPDRAEKRQNGRRFKENGEPAFTLTGQDIHGVYDGYKIRRLTPTECERLQGFPDGWTEGISDTQRYKCLGNAVTVNVVQAIMEKLLD